MAASSAWVPNRFALTLSTYPPRSRSSMWKVSRRGDPVTVRTPSLQREPSERDIAARVDTPLAHDNSLWRFCGDAMADVTAPTMLRQRSPNRAAAEPGPDLRTRSDGVVARVPHRVRGGGRGAA